MAKAAERVALLLDCPDSHAIFESLSTYPRSPR
jgi:hypothetical protein